MNPADTPALTELQKVKLEAHLLRVGLAQAHATIADLQAKLASSQLTAERAALEAEIVTDPTHWKIDWHTLTMVSVEPEKPNEQR